MGQTIVTESDIRALRSEACDAGDYDMVLICDVALDGSIDPDDYTVGDAHRIASMSQTDAVAECERVIRDARAQVSS